MTMKIENYSGTADTFTFPNNPQTFDDEITPNYTVTNVDYQRYHYFVSGGGINPKMLVLTGHFHGSSKNTSYLALSKHFSETQKLKKLYWEDDKFYLGVGNNIKKTHQSGRTNFLDYVANFETVIGVLFSNTQKTYTNGGAHATNAGNATTFIEEIAGDVTDGASDVVISDGLGNEITIPNSALTTGQEVIVKFVEMVDSGDGIYVTEYNYTTVAGTQTEAVSVTDGLGLLQLAASASTSTLSVTNLDAGWTAKFRDGYTA
jgi:hypothetical protein